MPAAVSSVESLWERCRCVRAATGMPAYPLYARGSGQYDQYDHRPDASEQREVPDRNETVVVGLIHVALPGTQVASLNEVSEGRGRMFIVLTDEYAEFIQRLRRVD